MLCAVHLAHYVSETGDRVMNNPFTLSFGKKPLQYISRLSQTQQILETFQAPVPSNQIFMITGSSLN